MDSDKVELHDGDRYVDTWDIDETGDGNGARAALLFDGGIRGQYVSNAVVELARAYGWDGSDYQCDIDESGKGSEPLLIETGNDAEEWLNTLTPEEWSFGFHEGDFFLANGAWWEIETY